MNSDTPLPPDFPAGPNPPDGAVIDYSLGSNVSGPVTLEILDSANKVIRKYSSADELQELDSKLAIPTYWVRPPQVLSARAGMHRFLWDMHYPPRPGKPAYPMQAVPHNTPPAPTSPWVMPGKYTVRLTVAGQSYTQPLTVRMDPRVKTPVAALNQQFQLSMQAYRDLLASETPAAQLKNAREQLKDLKQRAGTGPVAAQISALDAKLEKLEGEEVARPTRPLTIPDSLTSVRAQLKDLLRVLQGADVAPTAQATAAVADRDKALAALMAQWRALKSADIPNLNTELQRAGLPILKIAAAPGAADDDSEDVE